MKTTDISILLDDSGSMELIRDDVIGSYNRFIEDQQKLPGECYLSLAKFGTTFEWVTLGQPIRDASKLTRQNYAADSGSTALIDSVCKIIDDTGLRLSRTPEDQRPERVVIVIITDGQENASRQFTISAMRERIEHQKAKYGWDFVFLAANQDAILVGQHYGFAANKSMTFAANAGGVAAVSASLSTYMSNTRSVGDAEFTAQDRNAQAAAGVK